MKKINIRKLINSDTIDVVISIVLTSFLEIIKSILVFVFQNSSTDKKIAFENIGAIFEINLWDNIITIVLLTMLIWSVSGIAKMLEEKNKGKRKKIHTLAFFVTFLIAFSWYVIKVFFIVNTTIIIVTSIICVLLLTVLFSYFLDRENINKYNSDNRIA